MNKLIVALATPYATGAIHIVRVSGFNVYNKLNKICAKTITRKGYSIQRNQIIDQKTKKIIDDVLLMKFVSPKSYTGEDLIEINCHGSVDVAKEIINQIIMYCDAELAEPGEFTKRAFLNKKMDLNQAASVDLFIKTKNKYVRDSIVNSLLGKSSFELEKIQQKIFNLIGNFEIGIDYPEYEEGIVQFDIVKNQIKSMIKKLKKIETNSSKILEINNGIKIALVGKPNVGKSSLLNSFLNKNKAIVSSIAGTTRDVIEANVQLDNFDVTFLDTAGIRNHYSYLEKEGIKRTYATIDSADLIILVCSATEGVTKDEENILKYLNNNKKGYIICFNKKDLINSKTKIQLLSKQGLLISAKEKNIDNLVKQIQKYLEANLFNELNVSLLSSNWQINYLIKTIESLMLFQGSLDKTPYLDVLVEHLKAANEFLLKILGKLTDYNLMDEIFKNFCLGK
ncbi:tRNA uridine-5-carboxymethylaminomethyl(34) synthesis GTPase MnmE [Mycoplasmoides alvi]|uniref:tRNA uridine-5-carboxymethylaminomethyl(34) synthesis GTPase MnmE n=1 Tax=Mycoplasmoides alvi TaxID=78580 RepID=UPI000698087C|nr:tRNA uridine-5-carboxymethylaminomethyl(34) synthesis GTPase MnmE [Mycoplasmoides alvi]